jgi:hypothetical protein
MTFASVISASSGRRMKMPGGIADLHSRRGVPGVQHQQGAAGSADRPVRLDAFPPSLPG